MGEHVERLSILGLEALGFHLYFLFPSVSFLREHSRVIIFSFKGKKLGDNCFSHGVAFKDKNQKKLSSGKFNILVSNHL